MMVKLSIKQRRMKKILAIDDQHDNLVIIKAVIANNIPDCEVYLASSGNEGIELAKEIQPDVILLDIIMPVMDGYVTCEILKNSESTKHIPVVMITAIRTDSKSRVKGLDMGADAFLSKPIDSVEFTAQVNVMLRIKAAEDELRRKNNDLEIIIEERTFELKESERKYRSLYDYAPLPYQSLNEDGTLRDVNPAWLSVLGYTRDEVLGKNYADFLDPISRETFLDSFLVLKSRGWVSDVHFKLKHKDNSYIDISLEGCIGYNNDGSFKQTYCVFQDITQRMNAEKRNVKLTTAVRQSPSVIVITDTEGKIEYVNPKFSELTGYTLEESIGKTPSILKSGDLDSEVYKDLWEKVKAGKEWHGDFHNKKKNGELFWEKATVSPIIDENGEIINYLKVAEDITEKKKYEKVQKVLFNISNAANLSNNLAEFIGLIHKELEEIIDTTNFYVALYDEAKDYFTFPFYSDTQDKFHKAPAKQTLTKYIIKTNQTLMVDAALNQSLKEEGFIKDLGSVSKIWLGSPLVVDGKPIGAIAVQSYTNENAFNKSDERMFSFIAEQISISINRKNIQEKHTRSETRFRRLFEDLGDAIFVTKIGGSNSGHILEANSAASIQTGYSRQELLSMNISEDIYVDGTCDFNLQDMENALLKGDTIKTIEKKKRKDGSEYWTEMIVTPIEFQDEAASISINRDITDRIQIEVELKEALVKAEESDRLKSAFLANMSHEIRTPMNGIMGFTSLLMDDDISLEDVKEYSSVIERSSQRLLSTINDIMDISRIEAGQVDNQLVLVNIGEQLDDIHRLFGLEAENKGLKFNMNKNFKNEDSIIKIDEDKFYSVITNLIKNAIKFTENGGIEIGADKKVDGFHFYVKDTGIGISEDQQERVFQRFVQADLSLSSKYEGAGLGLPIVKAYLEVLGGDIRLESKERQGSIFYFNIPSH